MSRVFIEGMGHVSCTLEDLKAWDAEAAKKGKTREEIAAAKLAPGATPEPPKKRAAKKGAK